MKQETKLILSALRSACERDSNLDVFVKSFMTKIPAKQMSMLLDSGNAQVKIVLEELAKEMLSTFTPPTEAGGAAESLSKAIDAAPTQPSDTASTISSDEEESEYEEELAPSEEELEEDDNYGA